jgi:hypothetical protein
LLAQTTETGDATHDGSFESQHAVSEEGHSGASDESVPTASPVAASGSNAASSSGMGQNVLFVLMFLVIGVVVASLFFMPRTS